MKSQKFSCLAWTILFLALAGASGWFVYRRTATAGSAMVGGVIGAVVLLITLSWLMAIPDRIAEWLLIVRAQLGREQHDGKRVALIGTLRGHGDLAAPFSHERCVAYEYEVLTRDVTRNSNSSTTISERKAYEGFAMVPLLVEHGTDRTRLLAKPELKLARSHPTGNTAEGRAREYIENTKFEAPPAKIDDHPDLTNTDGRFRRDYRREPVVTNISECTLVERKLTPNESVCAIGVYSGDRRALISPVKLMLGGAFGTTAAWRVVNSVIAMIIFGAIALAVTAVFCANFPLDAAESSNPAWKLTWPEIELERMIERHVRTPMEKAGVLTSSSGFYLQDVCDGCAKGQLVVDGRTIELRHAAYIGGRAVHLSTTPGAKDGLTLTRGDSVVLTLDGKAAPIPASWLQEDDVVTALGSGPIADYSGRVTVIAPDRWLRARVTFKTKVNSEDWLSAR